MTTQTKTRKGWIGKLTTAAAVGALAVGGVVLPAAPAAAATGDRCHYDYIYDTVGCWNWGVLPTVRPAGEGIGEWCFFIKKATSGREGTITLYTWQRDSTGKAVCKFHSQKYLRF